MAKIELFSMVIFKYKKNRTLLLKEIAAKFRCDRDFLLEMQTLIERNGIHPSYFIFHILSKTELQNYPQVFKPAL